MTLTIQDREAVRAAVFGLDRWLDSMRQPGGYGGPVVHWWADCLDYTGPGLDWRYEGIINGYLNLWKLTGDSLWLSKACHAGDDLIEGQLPSGNYRNSEFELNPSTGGTPHEAACDLALLELAAVLRGIGNTIWKCYFRTAERNLKEFYIRRLWDEGWKSFRDDLTVPSFVPNKSATLVEAFFAHAFLSNSTDWIEIYVIPTLQAILKHQVSGGNLDGAIAQNSFGQKKVEKYFPFYVARCIPALLQGWQWTGIDRYADAARRAAGFILRWRYSDGSFPQLIYPGERVNRWPQWVAAVGDILRALDLARAIDIKYDRVPSLQWLMGGYQPDGSFQTAVGFGRVLPLSLVDDPRDRIPVVGWSDKTFRYLTSLLLEQSTGKTL